ncbi:MAG: hypothetical protein A2V66_03505 [Ignavibacteria bacterium RBG_13_36_8]|nr:MAG: hypothetical protein A2V66_03505 [Ignavibacteria bacterium RBG_13_36_8]
MIYDVFMNFLMDAGYWVVFLSPITALLFKKYIRSKDMKIFVLFIISLILLEFADHVLNYFKIYSPYLAHIMSLQFYGFLFYIFSLWMTNNRWKKILQLSIILYFFVWAVVHILGIETFDRLNILTSGLAYLPISAFIIIYLVKMDKRNLFKNYRYWIIILLFPFVFTVSALYLMFTYYEQLPKWMLEANKIIYLGSIILYQIGFSKGIQCLKYHKKYFWFYSEQ